MVQALIVVDEAAENVRHSALLHLAGSGVAIMPPVAALRK